MRCREEDYKMRPLDDVEMARLYTHSPRRRNGLSSSDSRHDKSVGKGRNRKEKNEFLVKEV